MMEHHGTASIAAADSGDTVMMGVTSILGAVGSAGDGLTWWAGYEAARYAIDHQDEWMPLARGERRAQAEKLIAGAADRDRDHKADIGTRFHAAAEECLLTGSWPDVERDVRPLVEQADRWLQAAQPDIEAAEMVVFNTRFGYAGTLDAIVVVQGERAVLDWKTKLDAYDRSGKPTKPYADKAVLQTCAYSRAESIALFRARRVERSFFPRAYAFSDTELALAVPMPKVDFGLIVHVTPEHCQGYPAVLDDRPWRAFLHAIEVYRWIHHQAPSAMGPPLLFTEGGQAGVDQGLAGTLA